MSKENEINKNQVKHENLNVCSKSNSESLDERLLAVNLRTKGGDELKRVRREENVG